MKETITYCPNKGFSLNEVYALLFEAQPLALSPQALHKVDRCYQFLKDFSSDKVIYGINTGFGPMAQYRIEDQSLKQLQYNIIRSHSAGAGAPLDPLNVKAAMLARLSTFLQGYSGVHTGLLQLLVDCINRDICPYIPEHGGVGASGDLVQLAHLGLALIGEGDVFHKGILCTATDAFAKEGLRPFEIHLREGLAVTNGTSVMTGIGLVNLIRAKQLLNWSVLASVFMNEIAASYDDHMSLELNATKRHEGQQRVAERMRAWTKGSQCVRKRENELYQKHTTEKFTHKVQPYYSLRCVPQILGPVWDELVQAEKLLIGELNSACDNPIVDPEAQNVYHGGNFHGDYVAYQMDKLKIGITKLTMLSERQLNYLFHDRINEILPPFVNLGVLGLNYGLQAAQFTATSTTAECQMLSNPMYIHSIPNNNDNQDIVSMGTNAALTTQRVIENSYQVMSVLFMALVQAVDCLQIQPKLAPKTRTIYNEIRSFFPVFTNDTPKYNEIKAVTSYLINHPQLYYGNESF